MWFTRVPPSQVFAVVGMSFLSLTGVGIHLSLASPISCCSIHVDAALAPLQLAAQAKSTEAVPIKVQLIAPPLYVMTTSSLDKLAGIEALTAAITACKEEIEAAGGQIFVKRAPTVTSSKDESDLQRMLEDLEAANAEVSGDEESSDGSGSDSESGSDDEGKDKKDAGAARGGAGGPASPRKKGGAGAP